MLAGRLGTLGLGLGLGALTLGLVRYAASVWGLAVAISMGVAAVALDRKRTEGAGPS